ncbi:hypothetical protein BHM03_00012768 [Ensete ventricosum]|nr:hypothetical protein BHM03_00012768 [Ensete ventricosum]
MELIPRVLYCLALFHHETSLIFAHVLIEKSAKQGDNYTVHNVNLRGAIMSISMNMDSKLLAVGTDKGYVSTP